jgi:hypothetical protein
MMKMANTELRAYHHLRPLQGVCIAKLYGSTAFEDTQALQDLGIYSDVRGVLLEYLDGISFDKLQPESEFVKKNQHMWQAGVNCMAAMAEYGVIHGDLEI